MTAVPDRGWRLRLAWGASAPVWGSGVLYCHTVVRYSGLAEVGGQGGGIHNDGLLTLTTSIVAHTTTTNCAGSITITSMGHNLASDGSCRLTDVTDQEHTVPRRHSLASNGGPTQTHALQADSPAIDAGDPTGCPDALGTT